MRRGQKQRTGEKNNIRGDKKTHKSKDKESKTEKGNKNDHKRIAKKLKNRTKLREKKQNIWRRGTK